MGDGQQWQEITQSIEPYASNGMAKTGHILSGEHELICKDMRISLHMGVSYVTFV